MKWLFLFTSTFSMLLHSQNVVNMGATPVTIDTVISGMDVPWQLVYGPDDHLWVTERKGVISRIDPVMKTKTIILDLTDTVYAVAESGLLGMALHPAFASKPEVFVVYTYQDGSAVRERLVKYIYNGSALSTPLVLLDGIAGANAHDGSRLLFLPDTTLLMTTGDGHVMSAPQDINALNGKVLRLKTDGSVPGDNPFPGKYTYTYGHRNAQGLCSGPNGKVYLSEHGPTTDDEFQALEPGRNYGWPDVHGYCNLPAEITFCSANNVKEPIVDWTPTIAPAGMTYYTNSSFPELDNSFLLTTLKTKKLVAIKLNAAGTSSVSETSYLQSMFGRLRDVCIGKLKEIYLATNGPESWNTEPGTHSILVLKTPLPGSVRKNNRNRDVSIYPTPVSGVLTIESPASSIMQVRLNDCTGAQVFSATLKDARHHTLSVRHLPAGVYVICVEMPEGLQRQKIVIQK